MKRVLSFLAIHFTTIIVLCSVLCWVGIAGFPEQRSVNLDLNPFFLYTTVIE